MRENQLNKYTIFFFQCKYKFRYPPIETHRKNGRSRYKTAAVGLPGYLLAVLLKTLVSGVSPFMTCLMSSLALLTTHDPDAITLQLTPGTHIVNSSYPAASITTAHLYENPSFEELQAELRKCSPESALIWRQGFRPSVALCTSADAVFIQNLLDGASLAAALDDTETVDSTPAFDFNTWLTQSAQSGLLVGAKLLST